MAATITSMPPLLSLCRNEVWAEVLCGGYRTGSTQLSVIFIERAALPPAGHAINIALPDGTALQFVAVAGVPDDSGTQYTIGSMADLAAALNAHPLFTESYRAQLADGGTSVAIGGRTPQVVIPSITFSAGGPYTTGNAQPNTDYTYAQNYSLRSAIWLEREWMSNAWERLPVNEHHPSPDRKAAIDLSGMVRPATGYDWPAYGLASAIRSLAPQRRYKLDVWERHGTPAKDRIIASSPVCFAWFAGQRQRDTPSFGDFAHILLGAGQPTPWLTFRGRGGRHEVSAAQQHVLGWYRNVPLNPTVQFRLFATVTYTDGTTASTYTVSDSGLGWGINEIALYPCGFQTLNLQQLQPAKTPVKYAVKLMRNSAGGASVQASEEHTFWLLPPDESELHLEFINSLGVAESMRCSGAWEEGLDVKVGTAFAQRSMANGTPPPASTSDARRLLISAGNTLQVCAGCADQAEHFALLDILFSPEVRLVDHAQRRKLPVIVQAAAQPVARRGADELEHIYMIDLKLTVGDPEVSWGNKAALPAPVGVAIGGMTGVIGADTGG